jgi:hypothetical protein
MCTTCASPTEGVASHHIHPTPRNPPLKYATVYVNVIRSSNTTSQITFCKLNPKNISDVRQIILHIVSMWDMEIPPSGSNWCNIEGISEIYYFEYNVFQIYGEQFYLLYCIAHLHDQTYLTSLCNMLCIIMPCWQNDHGQRLDFETASEVLTYWIIF